MASRVAAALFQLISLCSGSDEFTAEWNKRHVVAPRPSETMRSMRTGLTSYNAELCDQFTDRASRVLITSTEVVLANGYTCAVFDISKPSLSTLRGDFQGTGSYGANVLEGGAVLEWEDAQKVHASTDGGPASAIVTTNTSALVSVHISGIKDSSADASIEEDWTISLAANARSIEVNTSGRVIKPVQAKSVRHSFNFAATSVYALFDRGVVQMLHQDSKRSYYGSADGLSRLYALGGSGDDLHMAGNMSVALRRKPVAGHGVSQNVVIVSGELSGFQEILAGAELSPDEWTAGWSEVKTVTLPQDTAWSAEFALAPNNYDFPVHGPAGDLSTLSTVAPADLQAMLTGIYASPVGQLCTHDNGVEKGSRVAQMATTIASPGYGYQGNYNFFDPDNYLSTAALLYSGDDYLQDQVRQVLERNGDFINAKGQLPHHFVNKVPTYQALSGETQTGPNVFWILSCLNYAKATGNLTWLANYMPKLRNASAFLFHMIDPNFGLLNVPGSLMIDVFIRNQFTTDTNAMIVGFFREFAAAEHAVGNHTGSSKLNDLADSIAEHIDRLLWSNASNDHYVTQLNKDGSSRDFVDYDANLIALAHGVAPADRAAAAFKRIDGGRCTHGRATFVSEDYYGKHDTTSGNTGDSWCTMGRIGWFDALARKRYGDQASFDKLLLDPLIGDVNRWTWLHERYFCDGTPSRNRTFMYFEYPSVTAMMIHYVRYGMQLGLENITVSPFGPSSFAYHVGNIHLEYSTTDVALSVPGAGVKWITVTGLNDGNYNFVLGGFYAGTPWPQQTCATKGSGAVAVTHGVATFQATVGDMKGPCIVRLRKMGSGNLIV